MRYNDTTSAVILAVDFDRQRTGTRIARTLYAGRLLRVHASVPTPQVGCPRGSLHRPSIAVSPCAVAEPSCRKWRSVGHMPGKRSCDSAR